ncbi:alpha/beta fold hydrolase [Nonomuraea sp. CA-141351]|uniref:alpha/beta fold hydrolase n=1 Tax=Nonomuraea sp. CA-141351 TaxID=3239996 RepID=UPI003D9271F2
MTPTRGRSRSSRSSTLAQILTRVALAAGAAAVASAAYQTLASRRDRQRFMPPGMLVDIGGRRIHLWRDGVGSPAVVVVPALGEPALNWAGLLPKLAAETTTVLFDKAHLGWSDPAWGAGSARRHADDLRRALQQAGISPPYILVGHSAGGYVVRLFCAAQPEQVAGVVLVDASHPEQGRHFPWTRTKMLWRIVKWRLTPLGLRRLANELGWNGAATREVAARRLPPEWSRARMTLDFSDQQRRGELREMLATITINPRQVLRAAPTLGSTPLTVVSSSRTDPDLTDPTAIARRSAFYDIWEPLQKDLVSLSSSARHVVADPAGHHVHRHQPEVVVAEVLAHVRRVRAHA